MSTFLGSQFKQVMVNLDGNPIQRQLQPSKSAMEDARKKHLKEIPLEEVDLTIGYAIKTALITRIPSKPPQDQQSAQFAEDLHYDQQYDLYDLAKTITKAGDNDEIRLDEKQIDLILLRVKKLYTIEIYGILKDFLIKKT